MKTEILIQNQWKLGGFDSSEFNVEKVLVGVAPDVGWIDTYACEDVHSALIRHGRISDPAVGANDELCYWVEERVWVYRCSLQVGKGHPWLRFEGLDTFAEIYLNGTFVARCENMLVSHTLDIGPYARVGENDLIVCFYPVHAECAKKKLPEGFWINYSTDRAYARKAGYTFGWDWTPRVLTVGIWKPVYLVMEENGLLNGFQAVTTNLTPEGKSALIRLSAQCLHAPEGDWAYRFSIRDDQGRVVAQMTTDVSETTIELSNPRLWWTHDLGQPYLYTAECELIAQGQIQDQRLCRLGVRVIEMQTTLENGENCFVIRLNGKPLCARGANWVPVSNRLSGVKDGVYRRLVEMAQSAGMNLISVWGGGVYESDAFYNACDEMGLLVWQYFMFACGEYPDFDPQFVSAVREEVEKVVSRLAGHPCIAMWIGNVESEMLCQKIALQRPMYGRRLFEEWIPQWLKHLDPERCYLPSSPWGEKQMNGQDSYDRHNWDVWFKDLPYTAYAEDQTTFASEFGIHASPVLATVRKGCGQKVKLNDFAFRYFNRDQDLERMWYYLRTHVGEPKTIEEYVDLTMLVQAEALAFACEHFRRRFPRCGGALVWQHNDCCPVQSWSIIDVDLIPKAAYFAVKQSFASVAASILAVDDVVSEIWCANDSGNVRQVTMNVQVGSFLGYVAYEGKLTAVLKPGERKCLKKLAVGGRFYPNVIIANRPRQYYLSAYLEGQDRPQFRFFAQHKDLAFPPAQLQVKMESNSVEIQTDVFADMVKLDGEMEGLDVSDNYFHMAPHTKRIIRLSVLWGKPLIQRKLFLKALNSQAYELTM